MVLSLRSSSSVRCPDVCTGYGRESQDCHFQGGTIFNDAASGLIWVENQVSLGANKTFMGKACFKQCFMTNVSVKSSTIMVIMVSSLRRNFGVTVKRSNKVSHSLALVPNTRMRMLNILFRPSCISRDYLWFMSDNLSLWSFAVKHSVWVYNCVLNVRLGLTPLELITREGSDYKDLLRCMCGDVWCLFFKPNFRMTKNFPSGINEPKWVDLLFF